MADNLASLKDKYLRIAGALREEYGYPQWRQHLGPEDELVNTILSQNTSDTNRDRAYEALCARFPTWELCRDADVKDVIDAIRPAGLANQKGPRIQDALRTISHEDGTISLDHLLEMPIAEAKQYLTSIHGIGPKTAAIILLFAFNKPAFPVDTHVHRVTGRLGLIGPKITADQAHDVLEAIVPPEDYYAFHLNVIQHGRQVCHARNPKCGICAVLDDCDYFSSLPAEVKGQKEEQSENQ
jgi:endonuclease-3